MFAFCRLREWYVTDFNNRRGGDVDRMNSYSALLRCASVDGVVKGKELRVISGQFVLPESGSCFRKTALLGKHPAGMHRD